MLLVITASASNPSLEELTFMDVFEGADVVASHLSLAGVTGLDDQVGGISLGAAGVEVDAASAARDEASVGER